MRGAWKLRVGDTVFIQCKDDFYKNHLRGWFSVTSVDAAKSRLMIREEGGSDEFKVFHNRSSFCAIVEHEFNKYGESTWDEKKKQHRFIFVQISMFVKI